MIILELTGCPFQPLSAYLKALGILRLLSQQLTALDVRGRWTERYFVLESELDRKALIEFFLAKYRPTPVLAPWNGGSGFYAKDRKIGIDAIKNSSDARFLEYRAAISIAQRIVGLTGSEKADSTSKEDQRREDILRLCRNQLPDASVDWLDAAVAISMDNTRSFAPILGTGGNEGRLDYTNNFMENVAKLLILPDSETPVRSLLEHALFDVQTTGLQDIAVGQYDPGRSGGFNQGQGITTSRAIANPWNAILTIEGAIAWAGGIYRRQGVSYQSFLCSPFTVRASAVGYGSASDKDQVTARAEIWTPLWNRPARFSEIRSLLREGRAAVDGRPAQTGLEFAQAAASLGVDRAISGFVRYSLLKRRGDSYIALPAGRFPVVHRDQADLIRELAPLLKTAGWIAKGTQKEPPNSWPPLVRAVEEAMFNTLLYGGPQRLRDTAAAFGAMYRWLLRRKADSRPIGRLSSHWIEQCGASPEVRIAAALASFRSQPPCGPLLSNVLASDKQFSWSGRDLPERMSATLRRRAITGAAPDRSPYESERTTWHSDVARFLDRDVDDELIENLTFAFLLVDGVTDGDKLRGKPVENLTPWPVYCLLKQVFASEKINTPKGKVALKPDLAIPALLTAGRVAEACEIAARRLRSVGLMPISSNFSSDADAIRISAALLIPVRDLRGLRSVVVESTQF